MKIADGTERADETVRSFLMIGQSNMAGRGNLTDVPPIDNDLCFMLRNGRWQKLSEPVNPDRALSGSFASGISPAASFLDEYTRFYGVSAGLIPAADGGTKICQWQPGEILFDHAVMLTELAKRSSVFSGILWHQGESDCGCDEDVNKYETRFQHMLNGLLSALGNVPVVIGELSENTAESWGFKTRPQRLNSVLRKIASKNKNIAVASAKGLTLKTDGIHFDAQSCRIFGKRYFEALKTLLK
ncbi:MAG: sialate O-acetylesterase [Christensenellales bacterium]|jgi:hypothetical protein